MFDQYLIDNRVEEDDFYEIEDLVEEENGYVLQIHLYHSKNGLGNPKYFITG